MYKKILNIFLIVLVFIYIIFEELVWEKLAKPILNFISNLSLLKDFTPKIFQVSNTIYQTGVTEHEDLLIKYSNVDELKAHLDSLVSDVSSVRNERAKKEKQILSKKHEALAKKMTKKIKQLESEIQKSDKEFNKLINILYISKDFS